MRATILDNGRSCSKAYYVESSKFQEKKIFPDHIDGTLIIAEFLLDSRQTVYSGRIDPMGPHRHLQQEIKGELDSATRNVRRAEDLVMEMEFEYNERIANMASGLGQAAKIAELMKQKELRQESIGLENAYNAQKRVVRRFAMINDIYKIACAPTSRIIALTYIKGAVCRYSPTLATMPELDRIVKDLANALGDYLNGSLDDENDRKIRRLWQKIEYYTDT